MRYIVRKKEGIIMFRKPQDADEPKDSGRDRSLSDESDLEKLPGGEGGFFSDIPDTDKHKRY